MPMRLNGSCRCGAISFEADSSAPYPYQLCYCTICRKTAGGGGFAVNLLADAATLSITVEGRDSTRVYHAEICDDDGVCEMSEAERHFCPSCGSALWLYDPRWPNLVHPFASAIDTELPTPPNRVHLMLRYKAPWVEPAIGPDDGAYDEYPELSIEDWHRQRGLWIE